MAKEALRKKNALQEWQDEKKFQQKVLKDPKATAKEKAYAKSRITEADSYIAKIKNGK